MGRPASESPGDSPYKKGLEKGKTGKAQTVEKTFFHHQAEKKEGEEGE